MMNKSSGYLARIACVASQSHLGGSTGAGVDDDAEGGGTDRLVESLAAGGAELVEIGGGGTELA